MYVSSRSGKRFNLGILNFTTHSQNVTNIIIDPSKTYQTLFGFGGALTGAATYNKFRLKDPKTQEYLIKAYFGDEGIGYTIGRVPLGGSDSSLTDQSYDDTTGDFNLVNFSLIDEDIKYMIPFIQEAINLTKGGLKLFATPWSAPAWMKDNGNVTNGGSLIGSPNCQDDCRYYKTWANYFVRFFQEYNKHNITFWGLTVQNECGSVNPWNTMILNATNQRDFFKNLLGPAMKNDSLTKDIKIMIWDWNREGSRDYIDIVLSDQKAAPYVDGLAMHWYRDSVLGYPFTGDNALDDLHLNYPDKFILYTEGCNTYNNVTKVQIGNWKYGENYAIDIIDDLNHWSTGFVDYNIALNESGGPQWGRIVPFVLDAPIIVNMNGTEFYKQPNYYLIGHFSKFLVPGSVRLDIGLDQNVNSSLQGVSFLTPSKQIVAVLYNADSATNQTVSIGAKDGRQSLIVEIESKSIATLVWNWESQQTTTSKSGTNILSRNLCLLSLIFILGQ